MGRQIHVPKDAPKTDLLMAPVTNGEHEILSDRPCPLVLHAPSYWKPSMVKEPDAQIYFNLPEGEQEGQIFFEGKTLLYGPDGTLHGSEDGSAGWVSLPADRPGLWSFRPLENKLVRTRNLPPFFAFERKTNYFEPAIEWNREAVPPAPEPFPADSLYVRGAIDLPGNQALYLRGSRRLTLDGGELLTDGSGRALVPTREGTIEFFFKPTWGSFDDPGKPAYHRLLEMPTDREQKMDLLYKRDPVTPHWFHTHAMQVYLPVTGKKGWLGIRTHRRLLVEPYRWVHIALVWGHLRADRKPASPDKGGKLHALIFVDGQMGMCRYEATGSYGELNIDGLIRSLSLTGTMAGAIDELRVSNIARYTDDFAPPSRNQELELDQHTCALFHFNGNTDGSSRTHKGALPVSLKQ